MSPHVGPAATVSVRPSSRSKAANAGTPPSEFQSSLAGVLADSVIIGQMRSCSHCVRPRPARWARSSTAAMISILITLAVVSRWSGR